jgi:hypothetical protein
MQRLSWAPLFLIGVGALLVWSGPLNHPIVVLRLALQEPPKTLPLPIAGFPPVALQLTDRSH